MLGVVEILTSFELCQIRVEDWTLMVGNACGEIRSNSGMFERRPEFKVGVSFST